jgi:hypothetical protein
MPHDDPIPLLRWPSTGILVTAAFGLIAGLDLMSMHAGFWSQDPNDAMQVNGTTASDFPSGIDFNIGLALTNVSLFHIFGAICMRRGTNYKVALISAILGCIPFLSPAIYFGIPFGIWALVVLRRPDVRAAFAANGPSKS